ncbi:MAG TPA: nucleotidyl transferase AbiEii/AbiGii toxin family protein [Candidatus Aminicenantes bacterium]|nr:MAG: hypothetical protein C0168_01835 [Candidatus Aminicenantes bacterium]HEK85857.1 nucleotidyl transferase AbiEii/AbiGii toxin family protein [Candidatus Aminicenantes bacterium]
MKEQLKQLISGLSDNMKARSLVREYSQARILQFLQESGAFRSWIFHGGTALHFLFQLPRYSEDLDFALSETSANIDFPGIINHIRYAFEAEAYKVKTTISESRTVKVAFISFPGLWYELGLSPHSTETISIKIELDTNPPASGHTETSLVRRFVLLNILHYDKASFLSGKLHAILARRYVKGRDLYDLLWYLSDQTWPEPNFDFLNNALKQTGWRGPEITKKNWTDLVSKKISEFPWKRVVEDVRPFLENPAEINLLKKENILKLLKSRKA